jgi:hypothetical protein
VSPAAPFRNDYPVSLDRAYTVGLRSAQQWLSFKIDLPPKPIKFLKPVHRNRGGALHAFLCGHSRDRFPSLERFVQLQL